MQRIAPWLAFVVAAAIVVAAIIELDSRTNDEGLAIPTSTVTAHPSVVGPTLSPPEETSTPRATARGQPTPEPTPAPSFSRTPKPQPTPAETVRPPRTPSPTPIATVPLAPIDRSRGPTPHTGGSAVGSGIALAVLALAGRGLLNAPRMRDGQHPRLDSNQRPSA